MSSNRSPRVRAKLRACCTVQSPVGFAVTPPRCIRRLPCSMNTRTYIRSAARCPRAGINREDPGSLGMQELPPRRAGPARRRTDARSTQDLPHGRRRNCHAELHELAVNPPLSPQRILPRQATSRAMPGLAGGRPGLRRLLVPYFPAASLRCQASSVAGVTGKTSAQRPRGTAAPAQRTRPGQLARTVPGRPAAAVPRSHAGASAAQHPSPGHRGTPGRPGRVPGT